MSQDRPDRIVSGSSTLTSTLLEHGLADEVVLVVYPVRLGTGKRFFAEGTPARSFELVNTKAMPSGIVLPTYKLAGRFEDRIVRRRDTSVSHPNPHASRSRQPPQYSRTDSAGGSRRPVAHG